MFVGWERNHFVRERQGNLSEVTLEGAQCHEGVSHVNIGRKTLPGRGNAWDLKAVLMAPQSFRRPPPM